MKRYHLLMLVLSLAVVPALAFAAEPKNLKDVIALFTDILSYVIPFIFSLAIVAFLWGIAQYFFSQGEKLEEARDMMVYGVVALFVMLSVWGLVRILVNTFGFNTDIPQIQTGGSGFGSGSGTIFNNGGSGSIINNGGSGSVQNNGGSGSIINNGGSGTVGGGSETLNSGSGVQFGGTGSVENQGMTGTMGGGSETLR